MRHERRENSFMTRVLFLMCGLCVLLSGCGGAAALRAEVIQGKVEVVVFPVKAHNISIEGRPDQLSDVELPNQAFCEDVARDIRRKLETSQATAVDSPPPAPGIGQRRVEFVVESKEIYAMMRDTVGKTWICQPRLEITVIYQLRTGPLRVEHLGSITDSEAGWAFTSHAESPDLTSLRETYRKRQLIEPIYKHLCQRVRTKIQDLCKQAKEDS